MRITTCLAVIVAVGAASGIDTRPAQAEARLNGRWYVTLQTALDLAQPGDTIVISHTDEDVPIEMTTPVDRLTIKGNASLRAGLTLRGDGIRVEGIGVDGTLTIEGERATVSGCTLIGWGGPSLRISGSRATVRDCELAGDLTSVITGARARVERNEIYGTHGIEIRGDRARVRRNASRMEYAHRASRPGAAASIVHVVGDSARIERNELEWRYVDASSAREIERAMSESWRNPEIVDPTLLTGTAVSVDGDRARVSRNVISGAAFGIGVVGNDARIESNTVDHVDVAVQSRGDAARIARNDIRGALLGVDVEGSTFRVDRNDMTVGRRGLPTVTSEVVQGAKGDGPLVARTVWSVSGVGSVLDGCPAVRANTDEDGASITRNDVELPIGGVGIDLTTRGATVHRNEVVGSLDGEVSLSITGDDNRVSTNSIEDFGTHGLVVIGDGNRITNTVTTNGSGDAITVEGHGNLVDGARIDGSAGIGVHIEGDENRVQDVGVTDARDDAICIRGSSNVITDSQVVATWDDAVVIVGDNNRLDQIEAGSANGAGFLVATGADNVLTHCTAENCGATGLDNRATGTIVTSSSFTGNGVDLSDTGSFQSFDRNVVGLTR